VLKVKHLSSDYSTTKKKVLASVRRQEKEIKGI
jgi:hypothetical protein